MHSKGSCTRNAAVVIERFLQQINRFLWFLLRSTVHNKLCIVHAFYYTGWRHDICCI